MAEQLPVISPSHNVIQAEKKSTTLLGRGLAAIQSKQLAIIEQDKRYRQARDIYNRITSYGTERRFNSEAMPKQIGQTDLFEDDPLQPLLDILQQLADVFKVFQQLADQGHGKAYYPLARMYGGGQGIDQNLEKGHYYSRLAFDWCFANRTLDDPEIWIDLGSMYGDGQSIKQDYEETVFWYRKAAEQGHADAQFNLGCMYLYGDGIEQNEEEALFWFLKAVEQGHADAQFFSGQMYYIGQGTEQDVEQALFWHRKAAEQNHAEAQFFLGEIYYDRHPFEPEYEKAVFWYHKAAEQGHAGAQCNLGIIYNDGDFPGQHHEKAMFWFRKAAEQGYAPAQYNLGLMYVTQWFNESGDSEQALFWLHKAAEQGQPNAWQNLNFIYANIIRDEDISKPALMERFGINDRQAEVILDLKLRHIATLEEMRHHLKGQPDEWYVLVSSFGYGFKFQVKDLLNNNMVYKLFNALPIGIKILTPMLIHSESDLLAIATLEGRLLIFPVTELPTLTKGKDNKLIQIPAADVKDGKDSVVAAAVMPKNGQLKIIVCGKDRKRQFILMNEDVQYFTGSRAQKGERLPRGLQRIEGLEGG